MESVKCIQRGEKADSWKWEKMQLWMNEKEMHKGLGSATAIIDDHNGIKGMLRMPQKRDSSPLRWDGKALFLDRPAPWHVRLEELQFLFSQTVPWTPNLALAEQSWH